MSRGELDEAWSVTTDVGLDPRLVLGHPGVDSRIIGASTAVAKTDNTRLDPHRVLLAHHWTTRVSLE